MTAPAKKAPAKARAPRASAKPVIDYSTLTVEDVDAESVRGTRASMLDKTPFVQWMRHSRETGKGKQFTVAESAAEQTVRLLRSAARQVNCGVKIVAGEPVRGQVTIAFKAKDKKRVQPRKRS